MIGLDTNVLVRYVTGDDETQSTAVDRFIQRKLRPDSPGFISLVALAEMVWVLRSRYRADTDELVEIVRELASDVRFRLQDDHSVWLALEMVERSGADLPDALIAAIGRREGCSHTATFDADACRLPDMKLLET